MCRRRCSKPGEVQAAGLREENVKKRTGLGSGSIRTETGSVGTSPASLPVAWLQMPG
jgi:hypothetical protein